MLKIGNSIWTSPPQYKLGCSSTGVTVILMFDRYRTFTDDKYSNSLLLLDHLTTRNTQTGILSNSGD